MSDPNAIDLQTWRDVVTAIEQALQMDGATVEVHEAPEGYGHSMSVFLPNGRNVYIIVTRGRRKLPPYQALRQRIAERRQGG